MAIPEALLLRTQGHVHFRWMCAVLETLQVTSIMQACRHAQAWVRHMFTTARSCTSRGSCQG